MSKYYGSRLTRAVGWAIIYLIVILLFAFLFSCRTIQVQGDYLNSKMYGVVKDNKIESAKKKVPKTLPEKLQEILRKAKSLEEVIEKSKLAGISWVYLRELIKLFEKYDIQQGDMMPKEKK